jgi:RHS repeat-associated protein
LGVVEQTAAPFRNAPPPEQGAAGYIAQGLGGVLGLVSAPAQLIDTGIAMATAPLAALFPSLPAATLLGMHLGPPHAHGHPPSFIAPAPPVPLPSMGVLMLSGCWSVFINGAPAARCGDMGLGLTCGSLAPPFEIATGSSNVFIGGARAARLGDITRHCNPASALGVFDKVMAAAGAVVGVAGAVAQSNESSAAGEQAASNSGAEAEAAAATAAGKALGANTALAQAAADAAAFAMNALLGKDPGLPPGMGVVMGAPGTVVIGGIPMPALGDMAMGKLYEKLGNLARRMRRRGKPPPDANGTCGRAGEPVDVTTGANFNSYLDFDSRGLMQWRRHYTSARAGVQGFMGWGFRHEFQRELRVRLHRCVYVDEQGREVEFPGFRDGEPSVRSHGYILTRLDGGRYTIAHRGQPTLGFRVRDFEVDASLEFMVSEKGRLEFRYDPSGRLSEVLEQGEAGERHYRISYHPTGHLASLSERVASGGMRTRAAYTYDAQGRLVGTCDALGGKERYRYDAADRLTEMADRRGYVFRWRYDDQGRCIWTEGQDGLWPSTIEYLPERGCARVTELPGEVWTYRFDPDGVITQVDDPYGGRLTRERYPDGRVRREVDSGGRVTELLYDSNRTHYARRDRFGFLHPTQLEQPKWQNPLLLPLPDSCLEWAHGGWLAPVKEAVLGASRVTVEALPSDLRELASTVFQLRAPDAPAVPPTPQETFDALGRRVREVDARGRVREWKYDAAGNVVERKDRDGCVYRQEIVSWNLIGAKVDPLGNTTRYSFTPREKVKRIVDAGGTVSEYEHDAKDRLIRVWYQGLLMEEYDLELGDRVVEKRDRNGQVLVRYEPHRNGLVGVCKLASGETHTFDYDEHGRHTRVTTDLHDVRMQSLPDGRRFEDSRNGLGVSHWFLGDTPLRTRVLSRFEIGYVDEGNGGLRVTDPTGRVHRFRHDGSGVLVRELGNQTRELQQYDEEGRLLGRILERRTGQGAVPAWTVRYAYTPEGDLVQVRDSLRGLSTYTCDAAHRLVEERTPAGKRLRYELDAAGNVLRKPGLEWSHPAPGNRLHAANDETFTYDERDNLAMRESAARGTIRYVRDSLDRLIRVEDGQGEAWTAEYDALGRRARCGRGTRQTEFYWDGRRLAAEVSPEGRLRVYVYTGHDALVPFMFVDFDSKEAPRESGRPYFVFHDQVGMPLHIEDAQARVVWWAERVDPYGAVEVRPGAEVDYALRWPGHYFDADTGLHYNRFRYYDPRLGRYLENDPAGTRGGVNLYAYAANPLVQVDILGLHPGQGDKSHPSEASEHPPPQKHEGATEEGGQSRPKYTQDELAAFPGLKRGGGMTDEHARRVVAAMGVDDEHHRNHLRQDYDTVTQKQMDRKRNPIEQQKIKKDRDSKREAYINEQATKEHARGGREHSVTVIEHEDGTVSVGVSATPRGRKHAEDLAGVLNKRYPSNPPIYNSTTEPIPTKGLKSHPNAPEAGSCSEPHAAWTARSNNSPPKAYQTVWAGDRPNKHPLEAGPKPRQRDPEVTRPLDDPPDPMCPCKTCQLNGKEGRYKKLMDPNHDPNSTE